MVHCFKVGITSQKACETFSIKSFLIPRRKQQSCVLFNFKFSTSSLPYMKKNIQLFILNDGIDETKPKKSFDAILYILYSDCITKKILSTLIFISSFSLKKSRTPKMLTKKNIIRPVRLTKFLY